QALATMDQETRYQLFYTSSSPVQFPGDFPANFSIHSYRANSSLISLLWGLRVRGIESIFGFQSDIVHGTNYQLPFSRRAKSVVNFWDMSWAYYPEVVSRRRLAYLKRWVPVAARRADRIICNSEQVKCEICDYFGLEEHRVVVIPLGVDTSIFKPVEQSTHDEPYLLYVGTLDPRKNLKRLIEAYSQLKDAPKLVLCGAKGGSYPELASLVEKLEVNVEFTGYTEPPTLLNYYQNAYGLIVPSVYEGFGLPVLEAMACGVPVMISDIPVLREVAGDAALTVPLDDINGIVHGLRQLIEDDTLRQSLREKGLARARDFSWENTARLQVELYQTLSDE
ncbi:MAG: glycosyltransferase family 4 protein, partial [Chloroflexi bacterium]|nr:glycosyltransferase family 4 protein [Chloroflexota bacterium]